MAAIDSYARGALVEEWAASANLQIVNTGGVVTFERARGESVIDLSWCSSAIFLKIKNWKVEEETETLSDHRLISFTVELRNKQLERSRVNKAKLMPRWQYKTLNLEELEESVLRETWGQSAEFVSAEEGSEMVRRILTRINDGATRRVRQDVQRRPVYWWCPEVNLQRKKCISVRRKYLRIKKKKERVMVVVYEEALRCYREERRALNKEIVRAKMRAWDELLETLEKDPWGRLYLIVLKKLTNARNACESLPVNNVQRILEVLFPRDMTVNLFERERPNLLSSKRLNLWNLLREEDMANEPRLVDEEELALLTREMMKKGNPAPGLDGIRNMTLNMVTKTSPEWLLNIFNACIREGVIPKI
ncbi:uncharacterized protein LOC113562695 [Ooceraea biroi]|uniref:uncharacterized protein LOC113562695 n=1 Tax=Ooceraea biroi TaxID=2015173 RepID=UPI000F0776D4|nr:uncharacterized protein LOC113562695 [Ooceraea biroi]